MSGWNKLPVATEGGLLPHVSARLRQSVIDDVFLETGGAARLASEANKSTEAYWEFIKIWARGAARHSNVEVSTSDGIDKLLERLDERDRLENAKVINGEIMETADATD